MAAVAWGLTMPMFREDRMELPEALRRVEAALRHQTSTAASSSAAAATEAALGGASAPGGAAAPVPVSDELLRGCVICDDAPREVRFRCGHACCCEACAALVEAAGRECPICRATTHPLRSRVAEGAPTFELLPR